LSLLEVIPAISQVFGIAK